MKTAVFDIDGVLADYEGQLVKELYRRFGSVGLRNRDKYSLEDRFVDHPEILECAQMLTEDPNFYYGLPEDVAAIRFVEDLLDDGFLAVYLTSRPSTARGFTRRWLIRKLTDTNPLVFCGASDKVGWLESVYGNMDFVVEDNPEQIEKIRKAGLTVLCWSQPWNEGIFPRLYVRSTDQELMLWASEDTEAEPFFTMETGEKS